MIIVTGIGRCGTSAIMNYCINLGMNVGNVKWIKEYDAGYEHPEVLRINHDIFKKGYNEEIKEDIQRVNLDVVKDPLFLRSPEIIKSWVDARDDLSLLWMRREPKEIVASQKRKPDMTTPTYRCFEDMIIEKESQFMDQIHLINKVVSIQYPFNDEAFTFVSKLIPGDQEIWDKSTRYDPRLENEINSLQWKSKRP